MFKINMFLKTYQNIQNLNLKNYIFILINMLKILKEKELDQQLVIVKLDQENKIIENNDI